MARPRRGRNHMAPQEKPAARKLRAKPPIKVRKIETRHVETHVHTVAVPVGDVDIDERTRLMLGAASSVHQRVLQAREDPMEFLRLCWIGDDGNVFQPVAMHEDWMRSLQQDDRLILEAFKGSAKTSVISAFCVWTLGRDPNVRWKIVSNSDVRSRDKLFAIRRRIESPLVRAVFPNLRFADLGEISKHRVYLERTSGAKDPSVEALGVLATIVGARTDYLWFDDPCDYRNSIMQPDTREKVKGKLRLEWIPLLDNDGRVIYSATPYSIQDATAMVKQLKWSAIRVACGGPAEEFVSPWPDRFSSARLKRIYEEIGPTDYARAYQCLPLSEDVAPVKPAWIRYYSNGDLGDPAVLRCTQGYDLALSPKGDFFAGVTLLYDEVRNLIFVADAWHGHLTFLEQADAIVAGARWSPSRIAIESVAYQGALVQYVGERSPTPLPIWPVTPRGSKGQRLMELTPLLEQGRVLFHPRLHPREVSGNHRGDLVGELLQFGAGGHDDMIDALLMAVAALRSFTTPKSVDARGFEREGTSDLALRVTMI